MRILLPLLLIMTIGTACAPRQDDAATLRQQAIELQNEQQKMAERLAAFEEEVAALHRQLETLSPTFASTKLAPKRAAGTPVAATPATSSSSASPAVPPPTIIPFTPDKEKASTPATAAPAPATTAASEPAPKGADPISTAASIQAATSAHPANAEQAAYQKALIAYAQRNYAEATHAFDAFITEYPKARLLPNALYWKGECLYAQGQFADAAYAFKQVIVNHPKHPKTSDALLKAAMTYRQLGDTENRIMHARILREDFPASPAASKLDKLGL